MSKKLSTAQISIDSAGHLMDGQHRLMAVVPTKPSFKPEWELVTPDLARAWLATMRPNRYLSEWLYEAFARDLLADRYVPTHQGIAFDSSGRLCDGQHRLNGIIRSGRSAYMLVTRGLPEDAIRVIDCGRARQLKDRFAIVEGETQSKDRISIARIIAGANFSTGRTNHSDDEIWLLAKKLKPEMDWVLSVRSDFLRYAPVEAGFVYCYPRHPEKIGRFLEEVAIGDGLSVGNPAFTLRTALLSRRASSGFKGSLGGQIRQAWFRKVLNAALAYVKGRDLLQLKDGMAGVQYFGRHWNEPTTK